MGYLLDGLNHLAVRVHDIDRCVHFYRDILHLYLSSYDGRQAFFHCGEMEFVLLQDSGGGRHSGGQMAHFGFKVTDPAKLDYFAERVTAFGCSNIDGPNDTPGGRALYFTDPEGIVIEIYC